MQQPVPNDPDLENPDVEIRRSARRRRTVSAKREGNRTVILMPAGLPSSEEQRLVSRLLGKLEKSERRRQLGDPELEQRAARLAREFLGNRARPSSVRWSDNQHRRWGSCSSDGSIRISSMLRGLPLWVLDYVLVHELAHLQVRGHGPRFHQIVNAYPHADRAKAFLDGYVWGARRASPDAELPEPGEPDPDADDG